MKPNAALQKLFLGGSDAASARAILRKQARLPLAKPPKGVRRVGVTTFLAGLRQNVPFSPKYRASPAGKARVRSQRALSLGRVCHRSAFLFPESKEHANRAVPCPGRRPRAVTKRWVPAHATAARPPRAPQQWSRTLSSTARCPRQRRCRRDGRAQSSAFSARRASSPWQPRWPPRSGPSGHSGFLPLRHHHHQPHSTPPHSTPPPVPRSPPAPPPVPRSPPAPPRSPASGPHQHLQPHQSRSRLPSPASHPPPQG
jgi:hypothetical protein